MTVNKNQAGILYAETFLHWNGIVTSSVSAYLIICGTVTLEFSSKAFIISPLQRILSMHCSTE